MSALTDAEREAVDALFDAAWDRPVPEDRESWPEVSAHDEAMVGWEEAVESILAARLREAKAEALREAADNLPTFLDIVRRDHVHRWLCDRAAHEEDA